MNITNKELIMEEYMELKGTLEAMQYVKKNIDPPCSVSLYHEDTDGFDVLVLKVEAWVGRENIFTMDRKLSKVDIMATRYNPIDGLLYRFCQDFNEGYPLRLERIRSMIT